MDKMPQNKKEESDKTPIIQGVVVDDKDLAGETRIRDDADKAGTDLDSGLKKQSAPNGIPKGEKKKFKAVIVDTTDVMKAQARDAGDAAMTMEVPQNPDDLKGFKKFFKGEFWSRTGQKIWKHGLWRDYYRNKEVAKVREDILKTGNIFVGEGRDQAAHDKFVGDVMEQFSSEYEDTIHTEAGEKKRVMREEEPQEKAVKDAVKKLIIDYAAGRITREAFTEEENRLFKDLKTDTDGKKLRKKEDVMHASNLFQIAEQVKLAMEHGEFLEGEDFDIDLIYGKSKAGVRTEAKFTGAEKLAERLSHTRIGALVNETTLVAAFAIASTLTIKAAQGTARGAVKFIPIVGSALIGAGFAKLREGKKVEEERRQHAREMAKGETFDPAKMERRKEMEESRYGTQSAQEMIDALSRARAELIQHATILTPEILGQVTAGIAKLEAKIRLSDRRNIDLICYSDTTKVVEERKNLDIEKAKMKVELRKLFDAGKFTAPNGQNFESYFDSLATTEENLLISEKDTGIDAKDRIFNKMKSKRSWKAARTALMTGALGGLIAQEVMALGTDQIGIGEQVFQQNANVFSGGTPITAGGAHHLTGLAQLKHYFEGNLPKIGGGGVLHEAFPGSPIKLPSGASMVQNPDGSYNLLSGSQVIARNLTTNPDGTLTAPAQTILQNSGVNINNHLISGTAQQNLTPEQYLKNHSGQTHEMHRSWYDNDTKAFDKNELRTVWGERGTGINAKGEYVLDVSHMTPDGSFHGGLSANAQELLKKGELKMLISLSKETQHQVFEVPINASGQIIVDPNSEIGKIFFANAGGRAQFLGRFGEIGQDMGNNNFRMLSTIEGPGIKNVMDTVPTATPETILDIPQSSDYNLPQFIPIVPRTPLETTLKKGPPAEEKKKTIPPLPPKKEQGRITEGAKKELYAHREVKGYLEAHPEETKPPEAGSEVTDEEFAKFAGADGYSPEIAAAYYIYQNNIRNLFPVEQVWTDNAKYLSAKAMLEDRTLEGDENSVGGRLHSYVRRLSDATGLEPKNGPLIKDETVEEYMVRALKQASIAGKLYELGIKEGEIMDDETVDEPVEGEVVEGEVVKPNKIDGQPGNRLLDEHVEGEVIDEETDGREELPEQPGDRLLDEHVEEKRSPEFAKFVGENMFSLTEAELKQAYEMHQKNIRNIFPDEGVWNEDLANTLRAKTIFEDKTLEGDENSVGGKLHSYIRMLSKVMNLKPLGGPLERYETIEEFMAKCLQYAVVQKRLEQLEL